MPNRLFFADLEQEQTRTKGRDIEEANLGVFGLLERPAWENPHANSRTKGALQHFERLGVNHGAVLRDDVAPRKLVGIRGKLALEEPVLCLVVQVVCQLRPRPLRGSPARDTWRRSKSTPGLGSVSSQ